jgi:hypothetical protein
MILMVTDQIRMKLEDWLRSGYKFKYGVSEIAIHINDQRGFGYNSIKGIKPIETKEESQDKNNNGGEWGHTWRKLNKDAVATITGTSENKITRRRNFCAQRRAKQVELMRKADSSAGGAIRKDFGTLDSYEEYKALCALKSMTLETGKDTGLEKESEQIEEEEKRHQRAYDNWVKDIKEYPTVLLEKNKGKKDNKKEIDNLQVQMDKEALKIMSRNKQEEHDMEKRQNERTKVENKTAAETPLPDYCEEMDSLDTALEIEEKIVAGILPPDYGIWPPEKGSWECPIEIDDIDKDISEVEMLGVVTFGNLPDNRRNQEEKRN